MVSALVDPLPDAAGPRLEGVDTAPAQREGYGGERTRGGFE
jgi:hypothetical protein